MLARPNPLVLCQLHDRGMLIQAPYIVEPFLPASRGQAAFLEEVVPFAR